MLNKNQILETINKLPEQVSIEELLDELIFINKIQIGLEQSEKKLTSNTEQAKTELLRSPLSRG